MLSVFPMKSGYGKPGDRMMSLAPATLIYTALKTPTTDYHGRPVHAVGLKLTDQDLDAALGAMVETFRAAYPGATGTPRVPIRANREGTTLLWLESMRLPTIVDATGKPTDPPMAGATAKIFASICPYRRTDTQQGVGAYVQKIILTD